MPDLRRYYYYDLDRRERIAAVGGGTAIAAPVLDWDDEDDDPTPDFTVDFDETAVVAGNTVTVEIYSDAGLTTLVDTVEHVLDAGDIVAGTINMAGSSLADGTYYVRARVTGSGWSNTETVTIETLAAPVNTVAPVISGNVQVGQTLSTTDGTWDNSPTSYAYQWKRGGSDIGSATANTYVLTVGDAGQSITCAVTATNAAGSTPQASNALAIDVYVVLVAHAVDATDLTVYTFSSQALGIAAANRKIVVGVGGRKALGTPVVSSLSIGGTAASQKLQQTVDTASQDAELWIADIPSGTSGDIVVTFDEASARCGIGVWAVYGAGSSTPSDTEVQTSDNQGSRSLVIPAKGIGIGYMFVAASAARTFTFSTLSEDFDEDVEGASNVAHAGASLNSNAGTTMTTGADCASGSIVAICGVYAAWGP
jgi:hypothetical protein